MQFNYTRTFLFFWLLTLLSNLQARCVFESNLMAQNFKQDFAPDTAICLGSSIILHANANGLNPMTLPTGLSNGLVAWLPFNGNANDESGNDNHGTTNGPTLISDRFNQPNAAYSFDGFSNNISLFKSNTLNTKLMESKTISVWFKPSDSGNSEGGYIFRYGTITKKSATGEELIWGPDGDANLHVNNFSAREEKYFNQKSVVLSVNQWHMTTVVLNYSDSKVKWYIDGVLFKEYETDLFKANNPIIFIGSHTNETAFFKGSIDDFGVWNRELTPSEIATLYSFTSTQARYFWSTGDSTQSIQVTPTADTYYTYVAKIGSTQKTDSILVRAIKGVVPMLRVNNGQQCVSDQFFIFTDSLPNSNFPIVSKMWVTQGAIKDTIWGEGPVSFSYPLAGTYEVNLQLTNSLGCVSQSHTSQMVQVIGTPIPNITVNDSSGNFKNDGFICSGDFITLSAIGSDAGKGATKLSYKWYLNGNVWPETDSIESTIGANFTSSGLNDLFLVNVELSNEYGCAYMALDSLSTQLIQVNPLPNPSFETPLIGAQATFGSNAQNGNGGQLLCSGKVLFKGNASIGEGEVTNYLWDFGDGSTPILSDTSIVAHEYPANTNIHWNDASFPNTRYTIHATAISKEGCRAQISDVRDVKNSPVAKISLLGNGMQSIKNNLFVFANSSENKHPSFITQSFWDFGDGTTSSRTHVAPKKYDLPGNYLVSLIVTSNTGCTDTVFYPIEISADTLLAQNNCGANPNFTILQNDSIQRISGNKFTFINNSTHQIPGWVTAYTWSLGDGSALENKGSIFNKSYEDTGYYQVSLTAVSSFGCSFTYHKTVQVLPDYYANFTHKPNTCGNFEVAFTNTSIWDSSYVWYFGDGTSSTEKNPIHTYATQGTYQVTLAINQGKSFTTKAVVVAANPVANAIQMELKNCGNLYTFSSSAIGQNLRYEWSFSGGFGSLSNKSEVGRVFTDTSLQTVQVTIIADNRCFIVLPPLTFQPLTMIASGIKAMFSSTMVQNGPCQTGIQFTNTSSNATQFKWVFGDGATSPVSAKAHAFHAYPSAGYFQVSLIAMNDEGCSDTLTKEVYVSAAGYATPISDFTTEFPVQCISDHSFDFANITTIVGFGWVPKFYWDFGDGTFDRENTFTYGKKFKGQGNYLISLVAESNYGCKDTMSKWITVVPNSQCTPQMMRNKNNKLVGEMGEVEQLINSATTAVSGTIKENAGMVLFPNPNQGEFNLNANHLLGKEVRIQVLDMFGREVATPQMHLFIGPTINIQMNHLSEGTYLLMLSLSEGQMERIPFVLTQ